MNERTIQNALFPWLAFERGYLLSCPNYTPPRWFECDLWAVTKAGFAVEFEVKVSVADFRADAKKGPDERERQRYDLAKPERQANWEIRTKHQRLAAQDPRGPSRFFFVTPPGLLDGQPIPPWAGWITISDRLRPTVIRDAPKLHRTKAEPKTIEHCRSVFYHRYWNLRRRQPEGAEDTIPADP